MPDLLVMRSGAGDSMMFRTQGDDGGFEVAMTVKCQLFASTTKSWDELVAEAAEFATQVGKDRLINIAVSEAGGVDIGGAAARGSVFVWYWEQQLAI